MLTIDNLTFRISDRVLLDGACASLPGRAKAGLVGRNGAGKSTLLRLIAGELEPDAGSVELRRGVRIGTVAQTAPEGQLTPLEFTLAADGERASLLAEAALARSPERIAEIQLRLADIGADAAPARAAAILAGLGFDAAAQRRELDSLSGGWRMRAALAAALFQEADLLLLDEPSNHLDLESRLWLERHLQSCRSAILLVSHDRRLLNAVVDTVMHLEMRRLEIYSGDYDAFTAERRRRTAQAAAEIRNQEEQRRHLLSFVERFRSKASKARQAQAKLKALQRMETITPLPPDSRTVFRFPQPEEAPPPLISLDDVSVGYPHAEPVLTGLSLRIDPGDRISLLGGIGNGKTTLLRLLNSDLAPLGGSVTRAPKLRTGCFRQRQSETLDPDLSACQTLGSVFPAANEAQIRSRLGGFGISQERADVPVRSLSGGETARLLLACVTHDAPHLLLLDEPTNHLDIESREALVQAVNTYAGAVVFVTHDFHFTELCAEQIWIAENGVCRRFEGDINDYRDSVLSARSGLRAGRPRPESGPAAGSRRAVRRENARRRESVSDLRGEAARAEQLAAELSARKGAIEKQLADPSLYAGASSEIARLGRERAEIEKSIRAAEAAWLEAEEKIEIMNRKD